jgi:H+/Cl- antiporter ClcA
VTIETQKLKKYSKQPLVFCKWLLFACIVGLVVGTVASGFWFCFRWVTDARQTHGWLLYLLPVGGLVIVGLYRLCGLERDRGTNFVLIAVRENEGLALRTAPLVFVTTLITHLFGGSAGREGAILQIGGSVSGFIGRKMHLDEKDERVITMCGMAAAFSALFGTPMTAAVFSMEMISVGIMYYSAIVPCFLSAIIGYMLTLVFGVEPTVFAVTGFPGLTVLTLVKVVGMGVVCALLSIAFCRLMRFSPRLWKTLLPNEYLRVAVGGAAVIGLTLLVGTSDYNGAGGDVISAAMSGTAKPEAFVLKILFTMVTLGVGYKGGEIVPVFFTGATFGCVVAPVLGLDASFGAAVGLVSVFCGVTNCPMTSILLALELFGGKQMPLFALACAVSYMLSGYYSLFTEQKIVYSKLRPTYIDRKAK